MSFVENNFIIVSGHCVNAGGGNHGVSRCSSSGKYGGNELKCE